MSNQRVLVIDDEPDIRELLNITLGRMGIEADCVENLTLAKERLAQSQTGTVWSWWNSFSRNIPGCRSR